MKSLSTAWTNIRRSPYQAIAAISVMTLTFLAFSIFALIVFSSSRIVGYFESKPQVTAFFKDQSKQEDIDALKNSLASSGIVSSAEFVSKQEALKIYKQQNKNDPLLLDLVTADILPSSLEISTHKIDDLDVVATTLKKSPIVQEVVYQRDVISTLTGWTNALKKIGISVVIILALITVFIMAILIGIKIAQKREDIETMRLIGAGSWYIRWPFILEGMFYGFIGAVVGWLIAMLLVMIATPHLEAFLQGIPLLPFSWTTLLELLGIQIVLAAFLGAFSSYLAVLRYLK
jgi:cell division transport system permease protein